MGKTARHNILNASFIWLIVAVIAFSFLVITKHHHARLTGDATLYFSIAQKYVSGDFADAINGYWGPLLAWLIIPFLYFGSSHVFAINAINLVLGVLIIAGFWSLSHTFDVSENIRSILLISLLPVVLKFTLVQPMDTLLVCILVLYLSIIFRREYPRKIVSGIFCGILGAFAYFSKAYAFPFFIVHFSVMNVLHYFGNESKTIRRNVLKNVVAGFALFALISGAWIMVISDKYGHVTFSTMRETNFNAPGPDAMSGGLEFGVPIFYEGFFEPPNKTAFVVWEDPSYLRGEAWSAWQSWKYFKHFIKLFIKNIAEGLLIFESFSTFSMAIIVAYVLLIFRKPLKGMISERSLIYPMITLCLFSGGYALFHFEPRYLWLDNLLFLLMGGQVLHELFQREFFKNSVSKRILLAFFVASFIFTPTRLILQMENGGLDNEMYLLSTELKQFNIHGNIASNREYVPSHEAWHKTYRLAYWLNGRYYGQAREKITDDDLQTELKRFNIDYYFLWGESNHVPQFLSHYEEVTNGKIPGLKIFSLKERM
jgi:hypothetical protein